MAGASLDVEINDEQLEQLFNRLTRVSATPRAVLQDMGEHLLNAHQDRFDSATDPQGNPWAPLSEQYQKRKKRNTDKVLVLDGLLHDSLNYRVAGDTLSIGTPLIYGATHQLGDEKRNIPDRPFLGVADDDWPVLREILQEHIELAEKGR